jgi:hypothetical protein
VGIHKIQGGVVGIVEGDAECPFCRGRGYIPAEEYKALVTALVKLVKKYEADP